MVEADNDAKVAVAQAEDFLALPRRDKFLLEEGLDPLGDVPKRSWRQRLVDNLGISMPTKRELLIGGGLGFLFGAFELKLLQAHADSAEGLITLASWMIGVPFAIHFGVLFIRRFFPIQGYCLD